MKKRNFASISKGKFVLSAIAILAVSLSVAAIQPAAWEFNDLADYSQARMKGLEITPQGRVMVGLSASPIPVPADYVWSLAEFSDAVYLGTGDGARIYRSELGSDTVSLVWEGKGLEVYSLAKNENDNLIAGISPVGEVKIFGRQRGGLQEFFHFFIPDSYVWEVLPVGDDLWIASGSGKPDEGGAIYRYRNGRVELIHRAQDPHVLSLARLGNRIYAGTQGTVGLVFQIDGIFDAKPAVSVALDPVQNEVVELTAGVDGALYAVAVSQGLRTPVSTPAAEDEEAEEEEEEAPAPAPSPARSSPNAVYRIDPSGRADVWIPAKNGVRPMVAGPFGLLVATSDQGTVFRIDGLGKSSLVLRLDEKTILALSPNYVATGKPAVLYRIRKDPGAASLRSQVLDAGARATWGAFSWTASGDWSVRTRSGNSQTPDGTWSPWSEPVLPDGRISSPTGRYLQFEVVPRTATPDHFIRGLRIAYQVWNRSPRLSALAVKNVSFDARSTPKLGQAGPLGQVVNALLQAAKNVVKQSKDEPGEYTLDDFMRPFAGLMHVTWTAEDPDEDDLSARIELIEDASGRSFELVDDFDGEGYLVNTSNYPDGRYRIRVTVSDRAENNPGSEQAHFLISEIFTIDNTPPEVVAAIRSVGASDEFSGTAVDRMGHIAEILYLDAGGRWVKALPDDGIADQSRETFRFTRTRSDDAPPVVVKAIDQNGNVGYARMTPADR